MAKGLIHRHPVKYLASALGFLLQAFTSMSVDVLVPFFALNASFQLALVARGNFDQV